MKQQEERKGERYRTRSKRDRAGEEEEGGRGGQKKGRVTDNGPRRDIWDARGRVCVRLLSVLTLMFCFFFSPSPELQRFHLRSERLSLQLLFISPREIHVDLNMRLFVTLFL